MTGWIIFNPSVVLYAGEVVLNQIMYDSPLNEQITLPPYSNGEFVELYNMGDEPMELSGWVLCGEEKMERVVFPAGVVIAAGGFLLAWSGRCSGKRKLYRSVYSDRCCIVL